MSNEDFASHFAPYANENEIVMVFPQADNCFDYGQEGTIGEKAFTRDAEEMKFFKAIVDRVTSDKLQPVDMYRHPKYNYGMAYKPETWIVPSGKCNIRVFCETERSPVDGEIYGRCKSMDVDLKSKGNVKEIPNDKFREICHGESENIERKKVGRHDEL